MTHGWARLIRPGKWGAGMAAAGKSFEATIGVEVKRDTWSRVEISDSAEFFGTGKTVRVDVTVDDVKLENVGRWSPEPARPLRPEVIAASVRRLPTS